MNRLALILSALATGCSVLLVAPLLVKGLQRRFPDKNVLRTGSSRLIAKLSARIGPRLPVRFRVTTEKRIIMAGGLAGLTAENVVLGSLAFACLGFSLGAVLSFVTDNFLWPFIFASLGFVLPSLWLHDRVKARHQMILRHMAFHLDLLTLAVEAGMDFTAGLAKMVEKGKAGPLREEFNYMLSQLRVGVTRAQALKDTATRVDLPQLSTFIAAMIQADKLGVSIGKVLRIQSETVREERSQRAEKRANEAPVRILIPLVVFIFPTIWIILFAPLVFSFVF